MRREQDSETRLHEFNPVHRRRLEKLNGTHEFIQILVPECNDITACVYGDEC